MREKVVAATLDVIAREGLEGASVRAIAREMGVTTGVISHHFTDKHQLLAFALAGISNGISAEVGAALEQDDPEAGLMAIATSFLSDTPERERRWRAWLAFLAASLPSPVQMAVQERHYDQLRSCLLELLEALLRAGRLRATLDLETEADLLVAVMDGVGLHGVVRRAALEPGRQTEMITRYIRSLLRDPV